jgi:hypothetical protein
VSAPNVAAPHLSLAAEPESSIFIEYDTDDWALTSAGWPSRLVRLSKKLKSLSKFVGPGKITGRPQSAHEQPARAVPLSARPPTGASRPPAWGPESWALGAVVPRARPSNQRSTPRVTIDLFSEGHPLRTTAASDALSLREWAFPSEVTLYVHARRTTERGASAVELGRQDRERLFSSSAEWQPAGATQTESGMSCFLAALCVLVRHLEYRKPTADAVAGFLRALTRFAPAVHAFKALCTATPLAPAEKHALSSALYGLARSLVPSEVANERVFEQSRIFLHFLLHRFRKDDAQTEGEAWAEVSLMCAISSARLTHPVSFPTVAGLASKRYEMSTGPPLRRLERAHSARRTTSRPTHNEPAVARSIVQRARRHTVQHGGSLWCSVGGRPATVRRRHRAAAPCAPDGRQGARVLAVRRARACECAPRLEPARQGRQGF